MDLAEAKMMPCFCHKCEEIFSIPSRRGRPPKFCDNCIKSGEVPVYEEEKRESDIDAAKARVDRLEMMLRSRGTHIKQNQQNWR